MWLTQCFICHMKHWGGAVGLILQIWFLFCRFARIIILWWDSLQIPQKKRQQVSHIQRYITTDRWCKSDWIFWIFIPSWSVSWLSCRYWAALARISVEGSVRADGTFGVALRTGMPTIRMTTTRYQPCCQPFYPFSPCLSDSQHVSGSGRNSASNSASEANIKTSFICSSNRLRMLADQASGSLQMKSLTSDRLCSQASICFVFKH